jgi:hypothetical protein
MNPIVKKLSQETIYSYETCEFIYEFMGVLGLEQEDCTRKLLHKASGLGEDPIRLLFLMMLYAHQVGNFKGGKE